MKTFTRAKHGKSFRYFKNGAPLTDKKQIERINALRIPPAWQNVQIAAGARSKIQATGTDKAGRTQYIYSPAFRAKQEEQKFERILKFAQALPKMRRITNQHLKHRQPDREKVMACILQLMDTAYFRVGNENYAKENQTYGITTVRSKHATIKRDEVVFDFTGKSGQQHVKTITDKNHVRLIRQLDELPGYEIFKYIDKDGVVCDVKSTDVNQYIKEIMGDEFSAKDFRTWGGTVLASAHFVGEELDDDTKKGRQKAVTTCVKKVAKRLGNTPAVARSSYIDPRIINNFTNGYDYKKLRRTVESIQRKNYLTADEHCLLAQLQKA